MKNVTSIGVAWWRKFIRRYWLWCWWWLCWWLSTSSCPGGDQATRSPSLPTWFFYHFRWYQCDYCNFHNCSHWKHILNSSFIHPSRISWHNKIYSLCCILISWKYCSVQKSVDMSLPIVWGGAVKDNGAGWVGKGKEKRETSKLLKMFAKIKKIMTSTTRSLTLLVTRNWCGGERAWSSCWWDLKSSSKSNQYHHRILFDGPHCHHNLQSPEILSMATSPSSPSHWKLSIPPDDEAAKGHFNCIKSRYH